MLFLSVPCEMTNEAKEKLRALMREKTGEDCVVMDCGIQITSIPVKNDRDTGGGWEQDTAI